MNLTGRDEFPAQFNYIVFSSINKTSAKFPLVPLPDRTLALKP